MLEQLRYLVAAARTADVGVIAITAGDNKQVVRDVIADCFGADVAEYVVPGLTDKQVDEVVSAFGELARLAENSRSRELLRRPVIVDLFVRGGISGVPLSDAGSERALSGFLAALRAAGYQATAEDPGNQTQQPGFFSYSVRRIAQVSGVKS